MQLRPRQPDAKRRPSGICPAAGGDRAAGFGSCRIPPGETSIGPRLGRDGDRAGHAAHGDRAVRRSRGLPRAGGRAGASPDARRGDRCRDGDDPRAPRGGRRVPPRTRARAPRVPRAGRRARPADRVGRLPRADRPRPPPRGDRGPARREPRRRRPRRLAGHVPRGAALSRLQRALQARGGGRSRPGSHTSATASPTAACRSPRSAVSRARASPSGSTNVGSRTSPSTTSTRCDPRSQRGSAIRVPRSSRRP